MKILITSYYELKEALLSAANGLRKQGHTVINYPLFQNLHDVHSRRHNWKEHFINYINETDVDVILWWYFNVSTDDFVEIIAKTNKINILFNWDEPSNHIGCDVKNKAKYFDIVFGTCEESLYIYTDNGTKQAFCLYPGFDPLIHYPLIENAPEYECDISICCTNLYDDIVSFPNQCVVRKELVDNIYNNQETLFGSREIIGFGTKEFYVQEIDRDLSNDVIVKNH